MDQNAKIAFLMKRFVEALREHDQANPSHHAWGIGLSHFDMERLGLDEGEEIIPGIVIQVDGGTSGQFRVLCDGEHDSGEAQEEEEVVDAIAERELAEPLFAPAPGGPPRVTPPV